MKRKLLLIVASLLVSGMMFAQDNMHWPWEQSQYSAYESNMTVIGRAYLDDVIVSDRGTVEVAAFVDGVLRGSKLLIQPYPQSTLGYFVWTACYYNETGETFTFKAYDHANNVEYDLCSVTLQGQPNNQGDVDNPIEFRFTKTVEPTYGPDYPWVPSTNYDGTGMLVVAQIQINGENVDRATYEVGAFCGEECRGISGEALDDWTIYELGYFAFFNILGNDGDEINFYLYDIENDGICAVKCFQTVTLANGGELGIDVDNDLFVLNFVTEQTFTKEIAGFTGERDHYYLIASPIGEVSPTQVNHMLENEYDLYYFDQASELEWINIKDGNTNLVNGMGYLYANSQDVTLEFTGFPYNGDGKVTLIKNTGGNPMTTFEGWNLVGNPFADTAYITKPFYKMNKTGDAILGTSITGAIAPMEGVFVIAESDEETMTFSTTKPNNGKELALNLSNGRSIMDRAIVSFDASEFLPKFQFRDGSTKIYIPMDDKDYAVVSAEGEGEMPVNFKAEENGSFTITVNPKEVEFNYLHLIDNMTGDDVDLLQNPSYSFNAQTTDYTSRFKLVFATGVSDDDVFGFYSNGNWIINNDGDAILQVIDVTGRIMSDEEIHGSFSKHIEAAPGVYMLRLVKGNDVKVQKIVVE